MLQPEEIQKVTFEQSVFSGYKKEDVDAFLDKIYGEYSRLYQENGELVEKLKVCISKIEEYREDEKFLKTAIVNAQKLNETALQEIAVKKQEAEDSARKQAEDILSQARAEAERLTDESNRKIAEYKEKSTREYAQQQLEQANAFAAKKREYESMIQAKQDELADLQEQVDLFKASVLTIFEQQIALLQKLPESEKPEEETASVAENVPAEMIDEAPVIEEVVAEEDLCDTVETIDESQSVVEDIPEEETVANEIVIEEPAVEEEKQEVAFVAEENPEEDVTNQNLIVDEAASEPAVEEPAEDFGAEQIDIEELIAIKPSPVEPEAPKLPDFDVDEPVAEEEKEDFHLFGTSPLVFPTDIPDDEDETSSVKEKNSRFRKKLKFGVDFDVKKDK